MHRKPAVDTALYLPDYLLEVYQEDAARQVAQSWINRPVRTAPASRAGQSEQASAGVRRPDPMLVVAAILALVGWTVCTGWWTWLAMETGASLWRAFAGVGIGSLVIGTAVALWFLIARARRRPAGPQTEVAQAG